MVEEKVDFSVGVTAVLRETVGRMGGAEGRESYLLFEYLRSAMSKIARVDAFCVGLLDGFGSVAFPYNYDVSLPQRSVVDDAPDFLLIGPDGPTAWLLSRKRTYRFAEDDGQALHRGHMFGDIRSPSADAVIVRFLRSTDSGAEMFGMAAMHSYTALSYTDEQVAAFEWLADRVARILTRDREDLESLSILGGTVGDAALDLSVDRLNQGLAVIRREVESALDRLDPTVAELIEVLRGVHRGIDRVQSLAMQLLLAGDEQSAARFKALTPAQQRVALLLAEDLTNDAIAAVLHVAKSTVKSHVSSIMQRYEMSRERAAMDVRSYLRHPEVDRLSFEG